MEVLAEDRLLTPDEVIRDLRLDDRADPASALRHLRRTGQLKGVKVAGRWRYRESDIRQYVERCPTSDPPGDRRTDALTFRKAARMLRSRRTQNG